MSVWKNFGQYCNDRNYAELTVEGYESMLKLFEKKMGVSMEKFVPIAKRNHQKAGEMFLRYVRANKETCSTSHLRNVRNSLDAICRANKTSIDWKMIPLPKGSTKSRRKPYSKQEIQVIIETL
jgi:hypothetical protein